MGLAAGIQASPDLGRDGYCYARCQPPHSPQTAAVARQAMLEASAAVGMLAQRKENR